MIFAGALVAAGMLALGSFVLLAGREDAWRQARQDLNNLSITLERDISRNIALYDLSLQGALQAMQMPGIDDVSPEIRQAALFDQAASAEYLGSLLILDKTGMIIADSTSLKPHSLSLADRDYFTVHRLNPDAGLYVSQPFRSRLRGGDPSIAISRRMTAKDGSFAGVVVGTLRLAYFRALFDRLNLGQDGAITLLRTDGRLLARLPHRDEDFGRILGPTSQARVYLRTGQREVVGKAEIDGVERLLVFRPIPGLPLVLGVAASTKTILAAWWDRSIVIGTTLLILSAAVVALSTLFSRALQHRAHAEHTALQLAERLAVLATTDALTGLSNRGAFNERLEQEWRRSTRNQTALSLLMIDADQFKLFNDKYGHLEGDRILQTIADCMIKRVRRPADLVARFGGEEFVILLPETELDGAWVCAEGLRTDVLRLAMPHAESHQGVVTVSVGAATIYPMVGEPSSVLLQRADEALYAAKQSGRNRVVTSSPVEARFERAVSVTP